MKPKPCPQCQQVPDVKSVASIERLNVYRATISCCKIIASDVQKTREKDEEEVIKLWNEYV